MAETNTTLEFWKGNYWDQNKCPWHLSKPHDGLVDFQNKFLGVPNSSIRVLVPLCGKSVDLKWLYEQGYTVVGVEGVTEPIEEFFKEAGLEFEKSSYGDDGHRYQTADKRLTIVKHNFFTLGSDYDNYFDCVWDRAAQVAIELGHRELFAATVKRLAKPQFRILTITVEYAQEKVPGPPWSLTEDQIKNLYEGWAKVEKIRSKANNELEYISEKFIKAGVPITEGYYFLRN